MGKGKRGHVVTKRTPRSKPSRTKGKLTKRTKLIREVVREVAGFAPYEKRMLELLRNELDKRALLLAKNALALTNVPRKSARKCRTSFALNAKSKNKFIDVNKQFLLN